MSRLALAALLLLLPATALAEEAAERFSTDRPDLTEGAMPVGRGVWQLEAGWSVARGEGFTSHALGEGLLRIGLGPKLEARVLVPSLEWMSRGFGNAALGEAGAGFKFGTENAAGTRAAGLIAQVACPTDAAVRTSLRSTSELVAAGEAELGAGWGAGANLGLRWIDGKGGDANQQFGTLTLGRDLSDGLAMFIETVIERERRQNFLLYDGGLSWLMVPGLQLDGSLGVTEDGDGFGGLGVSKRW